MAGRAKDPKNQQTEGSVGEVGLSADGRRDASTRAETLASQIQTARLKDSYLAGDAIDILRGQLGGRVPYRTDLVEPDGGEDAVRVIGADRVSRPVVKSTSAG
jgi:hypothetical protein